MSESNIKKGIDDVIGQEKWLTEELVEKMASRSKPRVVFIKSLQPFLAVAVVFLIGVILYFLPQNDQLEQAQTDTMPGQSIEDGVLTDGYKDIVYDYFKAIEKRDYAAFQEVSRTETIVSPKEVFIKYENVDFSTPKIYKTIPMEDTIKLYVRHIDVRDGLEYFNIIYLDPATKTVSEDIYVDWLVYEELELPQEIQLNYEEKGLLTTIDKHDTVKHNMAAEVIEIMNGMRLMQFQTEDGVWQVLKGYNFTEEMVEFRLDLGVHEKLVTHASVISTTYKNREYISIYNEETDITRLVYYSEALDGYQTVTGSTGGHGLGAYAKDVNEEAFFFFNGDEDNIVTLKRDKLIAANVVDSLDVPEWQKDFFSIEVIGSVISLQYKEDYFQKSQYYDLEELDLLKRF